MSKQADKARRQALSQPSGEDIRVNMRATIAGLGRSPAPTGLATMACASTEEKTHDSALKRATSPRRCVVEHQGMKFVHHLDGSIVCEPVPGYSEVRVATVGDSTPGAPASDGPLPQLARVLGVTAGMAIFLGGYLGLTISSLEAYSALSNNRPVDHKKIARTVHEVVRCCVAGTLTGAIIAPMSAILGIVRVAVRPVLLGAAVHGVSRWVARHHIGAAAILKKLQSGDLSRQLDALRQLVARLSSSAPFCAQFKRLAGVEALLRMLEDMVAAAERGASAFPAPQATLTVRAIAELAKQGDAVNSMVDLGAVPLLLRAACLGLGPEPSTAPVVVPPSSPAASQGVGVGLEEGDATPAGHPALILHATAALARIASNHAVAQQMLASEPGAARLVVALLEQATARRVRGATAEACDELRGHAVTLAQALALEPVGKAALGSAGGVEALSAALMLSSPWTLGQATAAAALHALVRGDVDNQRRLAAVAPAGLSAAINRALAAGGAVAPGVGSGTLNGAAVVPTGSTAPTRPGSPSSQSGDQSMAWLLGPAGRALAPQDCHAHRADLLALTNVINRFSPSAYVMISARSSSSGRSSPGLTSSPLAISAPAGGVTAAPPAQATAATRRPRTFMGMLSRAPAIKTGPVPTVASPPAAPADAPAPAAPVAEPTSELKTAVETTVPTPAEVQQAPAEAVASGAVGAEEEGSEDWDCTVESAVVGEPQKVTVA